MSLGMSAQVLAQRNEREEALRRLLAGAGILQQMGDPTWQQMLADVADWRKEWGVDIFDPFYRAAAGEADLPAWLTAS